MGYIGYIRGVFREGGCFLKERPLRLAILSVISSQSAIND